MRTRVDRLVGYRSHTIAAETAKTRCRGLRRLKVPDRYDTAWLAVLHRRYQRVRVLPWIRGQSRHPTLQHAVLHATERGKPTRVTASTAYSLQTFRSRRAEAIENLRWYALRWKIETNNRILKSGDRDPALNNWRGVVPSVVSTTI